jgi:hypothetical protein
MRSPARTGAQRREYPATPSRRWVAAWAGMPGGQQGAGVRQDAGLCGRW